MWPNGHISKNKNKNIYELVGELNSAHEHKQETSRARELMVRVRSIGPINTPEWFTPQFANS